MREGCCCVSFAVHRRRKGRKRTHRTTSDLLPDPVLATDSARREDASISAGESGWRRLETRTNRRSMVAREERLRRVRDEGEKVKRSLLCSQARKEKGGVRE
jgi:hypothetical protein